jgi:hypothetical protein
MRTAGAKVYEREAGIPVRQKLGVVVPSCNPRLGMLKKEDQKFKASLGYIASSMPAWAT